MHKSCECAECKSLKRPLWWLDFRAETQVINKESLADLEARAMDTFIGKVEADMNAMTLDAKQKLADAVKRGDVVSSKIAQSIIDSLAAQQEKLATALYDAAVPYVRVIQDAGYAAGQAQLAGVTDAVLSSEPSPVALRAMQRTARRLAESVGRSAAERIGSIVTEGVENQLTLDEVTTLLEESGYNETSARTHARTQSAHAYTDGEIASWEDSEVVVGKKWLAEPGACKFCLQAQADFSGNEGIPLGENFYARGHTLNVGGESMALDFGNTNGPPLHPNCQCSMIAVTEYSRDNPK